ncbi:MAG TPA: HutD family protein [Burkholderiaceae bacterium]|nr:HutD family protein [Burkholderiaceae bacterium]
MSVHRFRADELPAVPWKNGGGTTRQVACWPPGAGFDDFEWRVSVADIATSGPFSAFPGVDRHILLLSGDGMRLRAGDGGFDHRLAVPLVPFAFSGDVAVQSDMLGGVSSDFNVMARRGRCRALVRVIDDVRELDASAHGLLMVAAGAWRANGEALGVGSGLWWAREPLAWRLVPTESRAKIIAVSFSEVEENRRRQRSE